ALLWDFMVSYYGGYRTAGDGERVAGRDAGVPQARMPALRKRRESTMQIWKSQRNVAGDQVRLELKKTAERYAARIPGLAPRTWDTRHACGERWALLGDAAGFADPVTGEGIYYALRSAELFADAYLAGAPLDYERRWREDFGHELQRASQMRRR